MYDPTIFENLKVAFENQIYDLDNIEGIITIINRTDRMDFAIMDRRFGLQFQLVGKPNVKAEIVLRASLDDIAGEILELPEKNLGCFLSIQFQHFVHNIECECIEIEQLLEGLWEDEIQITQTISFVYGQEPTQYANLTEISFKQKINEENMSEIGEFLENVLKTLELLVVK